MSRQDNHSANRNSAVDLAKENVLNSRRENLSNLLDEKTEELLSKLAEHVSSSAGAAVHHAHDGDLLRKCREQAKDVIGVVSMISFYGDGDAQQEALLRPLFSKLVGKASPAEVSENEARIYWYTTCFVFWLACISAIANDNYRMLAVLFNLPVPRPEADIPQHRLLESVAEGLELLQGTGALRGKSTSSSIDRSNHFAMEFRGFFEDLEPWFGDSDAFSSGRYGRLFDRLEVFQAIECWGCSPSNGDAPSGCVVFGGRFLETKDAGIIAALAELQEEIEAKGVNWLPSAAGVFSGSVEDLIKTADRLKRLRGFSKM